MSFVSPLLLLFLLPWLALVLWLLIGQRNRVNVPFLELWSGPVTSPKVRRTIQPPPVALACALVAMLLSILGAAGPVARSKKSAPAVTLVVDRGVTMAARPKESLPQLRVKRVIMVPAWSGLSADGSNWKDAPPSAIATESLLNAAIASALADSADPVVVWTDQHLDQADSRMIQIPPDSIPKNVSIVRLAASLSPRPEVMVRVRNQSSIKSGELAITSGAQTVRQTVSLPPIDGERNFFVDLPKVDDIVEARLAVTDDLRADNVAWLVRQQMWPGIEIRTQLPEELRRIVEVYQTHRPATEESKRIAVVDEISALGDQPGVVVKEALPGAKPPSGELALQVADHPIVKGIDWREIFRDVATAPPPGPGWTPLVQEDSQTLVAMRESPARQVWVGFKSPDFPKLKDYVIFWTNVFDWVGQGGDRFASELVHDIGPEWKLERSAAMEPFDLPPGVYKRGDGARIAMNATDIRFAPPPKTDWQRHLAALSNAPANTRDLRPLALIIALSFILAATLLWKRDPRFSLV